MQSNHNSLYQQFSSLSSQAKVSPDHLRFTISSESPKTILKPLTNLNRSSGNHIIGLNSYYSFAFRNPQRYPVLNITSKFQDHLPGKLTAITNGTAAGKFDKVFGCGEKHSCCWHLT